MLREQVISAGWTLRGRPCSPAELGLYDTTNAFCLAHTLESCCASGATKPRLGTWTVTSPVFHPCHPVRCHFILRAYIGAATRRTCCCPGPLLLLCCSPRTGSPGRKAAVESCARRPWWPEANTTWRREFLSVSCFVNATCS